MKAIYRILPHALIILAGMFLTFFTIDRFNTAMAFIDNDISKALLAVFSVVAIANGILLIRLQRKELGAERQAGGEIGVPQR